MNDHLTKNPGCCCGGGTVSVQGMDTAWSFRMARFDIGVPVNPGAAKKHWKRYQITESGSKHFRKWRANDAAWWIDQEASCDYTASAELTAKVGVWRDDNQMVEPETAYASTRTASRVETKGANYNESYKGDCGPNTDSPGLILWNPSDLSMVRNASCYQTNTYFGDLQTNTDATTESPPDSVTRNLRQVGANTGGGTRYLTDVTESASAEWSDQITLADVEAEMASQIPAYDWADKNWTDNGYGALGEVWPSVAPVLVESEVTLLPTHEDTIHDQGIDLTQTRFRLLLKDMAAPRVQVLFDTRFVPEDGEPGEWTRSHETLPLRVEQDAEGKTVLASDPFPSLPPLSGITSSGRREIRILDLLPLDD